VDETVLNRRELLLQQINQIGSIPSVEAIVLPLIGYLQQPLETLDMQRVVDLISHDNSLAANACTWRIRHCLDAGKPLPRHVVQSSRWACGECARSPCPAVS
jgi:hypothetical protein